MKNALNFLKTKKETKPKKDPLPEVVDPYVREQKDSFQLSTIDKRKSASFSGKIPSIQKDIEGRSFDIEFTKKKPTLFTQRKSVFNSTTKKKEKEEKEIEQEKIEDPLEDIGTQVEEYVTEHEQIDVSKIIEETELATTPRDTKKDSVHRFKHIRTKTIQKKVMVQLPSTAPPPIPLSTNNSEVEGKTETPKEKQKSASTNNLPEPEVKPIKSKDLNILLSLPHNKYVPNSMSIKKELMPKGDSMKLIGKQISHYKRFNTLRQVYKKGNFCKQNRIRAQLVKEIYQTEEEYVKSLLTLTVVYYFPLERKKLIDTKDLHTIFGKIPMILELHTNLMSRMGDEMKQYSPKIGKVFVEFAPSLKVYPEYINNYDDVTNLLRDLMNSKKPFDQFLKKQMMLPECGNLPVESFLIKPIQRIPRYKLLLRDLVKETPENHVDFADLQTAHDKIEEVAGYVNEQKREAEHRKVVFNLSQNLPESVQKVLLDANRKLLIHGKVEVKQDEIKKDSVDNVIESQEFNMYLFNDLILLIGENDELIQINTELSIVQTQEIDHSMKIFSTVFRIRYMFTVKFQEKEFEKWNKLINEVIEKIQKKSSDDSGIPIEEFVKIEKQRIEIENNIPIIANEQQKIEQILKNDDLKITKLSDSLEANREKLRKLQELILQEEAELKNSQQEKTTHIEKQGSICKEMEKTKSKALELDQKILKIVHNDHDKYKKIFNCDPIE